MVNPNHITPYGEISDEERELADDLVFNRREDALELFINHFESKGAEAEAAGAADPTEGMEPEEALHFHILRRKKDGVEDWIDRCVEKIGAVPTLNEVLLPAMKEVGDKFGAGELILPFVLQSAEVMKRAVARLENYLDRIEGYTKGTVVLATVFGDVHDIGKSLVNTILTNNGYTVVDLGKQVPVGTIIEAAKEHDATAIGLSALLVSTSKQMPLAVQELHEQGLEYPVLIGGAAINRAFSLRAIYPHGKDDDTQYAPGALLLQGRLRGPRRDGPARRGRGARGARREGPRRRAGAARQGPRARGAADRRRQRPLGRAHRQPGAHAAVLGRARDPRRPRRALPPPRHARAVQAPLGRARREGRGVEGAASSDDFQPRLERMWREQDYLRPRALLGYFPCYSEGNDIVVLDPDGPRARADALHLPAPARSTTASAWPTTTARRTPSELDVVALTAVTSGSEVTELMARLEADGEFAEQLFVHGLGVQTAEGLAEWLHSKVREDLGHQRRPRAGATRGATRRCPTSPST